MNTELIKEMSDRAKSEVPANLTTDEWITKYNEILAEHIIRECYNACAERSMELKDAAESFGAFRAALAIRRKFKLDELEGEEIDQ